MSAVGYGLHEWSLVEMELARCFSTFVWADMHAIFGAIISFETRLSACDAAVAKTDLSELDRALWAKLSDRLSRFYRRRHQIAHFTLGWNNKDVPVLYPFMTTGNFLGGAHVGLNMLDVQERIGKFQELFFALKWFRENLVRQRTPPQTPATPLPEEPPLVVRLRALAIQSLEERKPRGKSDPR